jgi:ABC-type bacteriocin/lantibiotic exporter with double-glycine peptidase domain
MNYAMLFTVGLSQIFMEDLLPEGNLKPFALQNCAIDCVYMALMFYNRSPDYTELVKKIPTAPDGSSKLSDIYTFLKSRDLSVEAINGQLGDLKVPNTGLILHLRFSSKQDDPSLNAQQHFAFAFYDFNNACFIVADRFQSIHLMKWSEEDLTSCWTGNALIIRDEK